MFSIDTSNALSHLLHPDWVSMDIDKLGKSFYNSDEQPLSEPIRNLKAKTLEEAYSRNDIETLIEYLKSTDGLINNELRSKIWPVLLGIHSDFSENNTVPPSVSSSLSSSMTKSVDSTGLTLKLKLQSDKVSASFLLDDLDVVDLPPHKDEEQVKLDIQRSFTILSHIQSYHQLEGNNESYTAIFSKSDVDELKKKLLTLIIRILRKYPSLHYYQGFHDIASIVLIVCHDRDLNTIDEELAFNILEYFTIYHLRDFMIADISLSVNHLLLIPYILETVDHDLFELIKQTSNGFFLFNGTHFDYKFYQGLSSILTVFSHDLGSLQQILIIWDFMFSYNSVLTNIYVYVSALVYFKEDIFQYLNIPLDDEYCDYHEIDRDLVHTQISPTNLFKSTTDTDLLKILNIARSLIKKYPIDTLENSNETYSVWFEKFNPHSVLMTTSTVCWSGKEIRDKVLEYKYLLSDKETSSLDLAGWIQIQDEEICKQTIYTNEIEQEILREQEILASSASEYQSNDSGSILLSSSLSSLSSTSSAVNAKLISTSSILFKKLLFKPDDSKVEEGKPNGHLPLYLRNVYKISFTIGFIGFILHFLLSKNNRFHDAVLKMLTSSNAVVSIKHEVSTLGNLLSTEISNAVSGTFRYLAESDVVTHSVSIGQVGLGNLRNNVYGFNG